MHCCVATREIRMMRYAAKLLFQYRVEGEQTTHRLCEERILNFKARSGREALRIAKQRGKQGNEMTTVAFVFYVLTKSDPLRNRGINLSQDFLCLEQIGLRGLKMPEGRIKRTLRRLIFL